MADKPGVPELSVITPAFREGPRIYDSLHLLQSSIERLGRTYEIIVVSDGSDDDTVAEARRHPEMTVLEYPHQRGKGYAIRHGIQHSRGRLVAYIDSDMELHPDGIGTLIDKVEAGADAAVGSKRDPDSKVHYPFFRRLQSAVYQRMIRVLFHFDISDTQTGLKVFRGDLLRSVASLLESDGFAFDLELLVALHEAGATIVEGPVQLDYTFSTTTGVRAVIDVLRDTGRIYTKNRSRQRRALRST